MLLFRVFVSSRLHLCLGTMPDIPHVVIIGGGFGGLDAARALAGAPVRVTLLDRHNYHLFQPLLYQVATASLSPADIASPIRWILRRQRNVQVLLAEARAIEPARRVVIDSGPGSGCGSRQGRALWQEHTTTTSSSRPAPRTPISAIPNGPRARPASKRSTMRWRYGGRFCSRSKPPNAKPTPTRRRGCSPSSSSAADRPASSSPARWPRSPAARCERTFEHQARIGADRAARRRSARARDVPGAAAAGGARIVGPARRGGADESDCHRRDADGVVWRTRRPSVRRCRRRADRRADRVVGGRRRRVAAGDRSVVPLDRVGRVLAEPTLTVPGHPDIFVVGDICALQQDGKPLPGVAQVAKQGARTRHETSCARFAANRSCRSAIATTATWRRSAAVRRSRRSEGSGPPASSRG